VILGFALLSPATRADTSVAPAPPAAFACDSNAYEHSAFELARRSKRITDLGPHAAGLSFRYAGVRHALFSSFWSSKPGGSIVFDPNGKEVSHVAADSAALVEDADGRLLGLLAVDEKRHELRYLDPATGALRWKVSPAPFFADSAATLVAGDTLYVAHFGRISSGAALVAVDLKSGALRWTGDVEQLNVAHSEYYNDVTLTLDGTAVVLRGTEAGGCTLQRFDRATGKRLSSQLKHLW
jgi:outer membrane protein assembly factor BamB